MRKLEKQMSDHFVYAVHQAQGEMTGLDVRVVNMILEGKTLMVHDDLYLPTTEKELLEWMYNVAPILLTYHEQGLSTAVFFGMFNTDTARHVDPELVYQISMIRDIVSILKFGRLGKIPTYSTEEEDEIFSGFQFDKSFYLGSEEAVRLNFDSLYDEQRVGHCPRLENPFGCEYKIYAAMKALRPMFPLPPDLDTVKSPLLRMKWVLKWRAENSKMIEMLSKHVRGMQSFVLSAAYWMLMAEDVTIQGVHLKCARAKIYAMYENTTSFLRKFTVPQASGPDGTLLNLYEGFDIIDREMDEFFVLVRICMSLTVSVEHNDHIYNRLDGHRFEVNMVGVPLVHVEACITDAICRILPEPLQEALGHAIVQATSSSSTLLRLNLAALGEAFDVVTDVTQTAQYAARAARGYLLMTNFEILQGTSFFLREMFLKETKQVNPHAIYRGRRVSRVECSDGEHATIRVEWSADSYGVNWHRANSKMLHKENDPEQKMIVRLASGIAQIQMEILTALRQRRITQLQQASGPDSIDDQRVKHFFPVNCIIPSVIIGDTTLTLCEWMHRLDACLTRKAKDWMFVSDILAPILKDNRAMRGLDMELNLLPPQHLRERYWLDPGKNYNRPPGEYDFNQCEKNNVMFEHAPGDGFMDKVCFVLKMIGPPRAMHVHRALVFGRDHPRVWEYVTSARLELGIHPTKIVYQFRNLIVRDSLECHSRMKQNVKLDYNGGGSTTQLFRTQLENSSFGGHLRIQVLGVSAQRYQKALTDQTHSLSRGYTPKPIGWMAWCSMFDLGLCFVDGRGIMPIELYVKQLNPGLYHSMQEQLKKEMPNHFFWKWHSGMMLYPTPSFGTLMSFELYPDPVLFDSKYAYRMLYPEIALMRGFMELTVSHGDVPGQSGSYEIYATIRESTETLTINKWCVDNETKIAHQVIKFSGQTSKRVAERKPTLGPSAAQQKRDAWTAVPKAKAKPKLVPYQPKAKVAPAPTTTPIATTPPIPEPGKDKPPVSSEASGPDVDMSVHLSDEDEAVLDTSSGKGLPARFSPREDGESVIDDDMVTIVSSTFSDRDAAGIANLIDLLDEARDVERAPTPGADYTHDVERYEYEGEFGKEEWLKLVTPLLNGVPVEEREARGVSWEAYQDLQARKMHTESLKMRRQVLGIDEKMVQMAMLQSKIAWHLDTKHLTNGMLLNDPTNPVNWNSRKSLRRLPPARDGRWEIVIPLDESQQYSSWCIVLRYALPVRESDYPAILEFVFHERQDWVSTAVSDPENRVTKEFNFCRYNGPEHVWPHLREIISCFFDEHGKAPNGSTEHKLFDLIGHTPDIAEMNDTVQKTIEDLAGKVTSTCSIGDLLDGIVGERLMFDLERPIFKKKNRHDAKLKSVTKLPKEFLNTWRSYLRDSESKLIYGLSERQRDALLYSLKQKYGRQKKKLVNTSEVDWLPVLRAGIQEFIEAKAKGFVMGNKHLPTISEEVTDAGSKTRVTPQGFEVTALASGPVGLFKLIREKDPRLLCPHDAIKSLIRFEEAKEVLEFLRVQCTKPMDSVDNDLLNQLRVIFALADSRTDREKMENQHLPHVCRTCMKVMDILGSMDSTAHTRLYRTCGTCLSVFAQDMVDKIKNEVHLKQTSWDDINLVALYWSKANWTHAEEMSKLDRECSNLSEIGELFEALSLKQTEVRLSDDSTAEVVSNWQPTEATINAEGYENEEETEVSEYVKQWLADKKASDDLLVVLNNDKASGPARCCVAKKHDVYQKRVEMANKEPLMRGLPVVNWPPHLPQNCAEACEGPWIRCKVPFCGHLICSKHNLAKWRCLCGEHTKAEIRVVTQSICCVGSERQRKAFELAETHGLDLKGYIEVIQMIHDEPDQAPGPECLANIEAVERVFQEQGISESPWNLLVGQCGPVLLKCKQVCGEEACDHGVCNVHVGVNGRCTCGEKHVSTESSVQYIVDEIASRTSTGGTAVTEAVLERLRENPQPAVLRQIEAALGPLILHGSTIRNVDEEILIRIIATSMQYDSQVGVEFSGQFVRFHRHGPSAAQFARYMQIIALHQHTTFTEMKQKERSRIIREAHNFVERSECESCYSDLPKHAKFSMQDDCDCCAFKCPLCSVTEYAYDTNDSPVYAAVISGEEFRQSRGTESLVIVGSEEAFEEVYLDPYQQPLFLNCHPSDSVTCIDCEEQQFAYLMVYDGARDNWSCMNCQKLYGFPVVDRAEVRALNLQGLVELAEVRRVQSVVALFVAEADMNDNASGTKRCNGNGHFAPVKLNMGPQGPRKWRPTVAPGPEFHASRHFFREVLCDTKTGEFTLFTELCKRIDTIGHTAVFEDLRENAVPRVVWTDGDVIQIICRDHSWRPWMSMVVFLQHYPQYINVVSVASTFWVDSPFYRASLALHEARQKYECQSGAESVDRFDIVELLERIDVIAETEIWLSWIVVRLSMHSYIPEGPDDMFVKSIGAELVIQAFADLFGWKHSHENMKYGCPYNATLKLKLRTITRTFEWSETLQEWTHQKSLWLELDLQQREWYQEWHNWTSRWKDTRNQALVDLFIKKIWGKEISGKEQQEMLHSSMDDSDDDLMFDMSTDEIFERMVLGRLMNDLPELLKLKSLPGLNRKEKPYDRAMKDSMIVTLTPSKLLVCEECLRKSSTVEQCMCVSRKFSRCRLSLCYYPHTASCHRRVCEDCRSPMDARLCLGCCENQKGLWPEGKPQAGGARKYQKKCIFSVVRKRREFFIDREKGTVRRCLRAVYPQASGQLPECFDIGDSWALGDVDTIRSFLVPSAADTDVLPSARCEMCNAWTKNEVRKDYFVCKSCVRSGS